MNHTGLPCHTLEVAFGRVVSINSRRRSQIPRNARGRACEYAAIWSPPLGACSALFDCLGFCIVNSHVRPNNQVSRGARAGNFNAQEVVMPAPYSVTTWLDHESRPHG